jgi:anti-anti-sigma factor
VQASAITGPSGETVLTLGGEIDLATADEVRKLGGDAVAANPSAELHVDLSQVTFLDSSGISALVHIRNLAAPHELVVADPSSRVCRT